MGHINQVHAPHFTSWKPILILASHLRLGLTSGLLPSGFPTKALYAPLFPLDRAPCPTYLSYSSWFKGKKVKCTLVQAMRLCTGRTACRGSRSIALPFHDHGTRSGWGVSVTPRPLFTPGKDPVPIGWAPGPVWTGAENLAPTGIRSPNRPARSQSLYRLRYPARIFFFGLVTRIILG